MTNMEILTAIDETIGMEARAIERLRTTLEHDAMLQMVHKICECRGTIVLSGSGTSGVVCRKIAHTLNCIRRPAVFLEPSEALHGGLGFLRKQDIFILISNGGETAELVEMLPACKASGCLLAVVTAKKSSSLARAADMVVLVSVESEAGPHNMFATTSTLAVLSTFDAIMMASALHMEYRREQFTNIHPGGAVGAMLKSEGTD